MDQDEFIKLSKWVRDTIIPQYEAFKFDKKRYKYKFFIDTNGSIHSKYIIDILIDYYKDWNILVYEFIDPYDYTYIVIKSIDV